MDASSSARFATLKFFIAMIDKTLVLLAAGKGSRFGGLKQIHRFQPQEATLAEFAIWDALQVGFNRFVAIVSEDTHEFFGAIFKKLNLNKVSQCVLQTQENVPADLCKNRQKPWGTGHALLCIRHAVHSPFVVVNADDFYGRKAYQFASIFIDNNPVNFALVGYPLEKTLSHYGPVSRALCTIQNDTVIGLDEWTHIEKFEDKICGERDHKSIVLQKDTLTSMNFWILQPTIFDELQNQWELFLKHIHQSQTQEFYLPTAIQELAKEKEVAIKMLPNVDDVWLGITYPQDIMDTQQALLLLTQQGVYPQRFSI